ncbi:hypothetical protein [Nocardia sp. NRRL S-836]|uniref:hypothetical protein n=1 Tax=Nocardia sp. NRRL S-836 TaxID=1519492 RepID=UPI0006AD8CD0|nr:hypothetical protein [Nocardia sp. NRRL S-836]KOV85291.1 hypothetical protein ADL03_14080 [Nocardia sp. NRRL S-836]
MFRKATAAALVLSAVPAVLTMTFLAGTAQADQTWRGGDGCDTPWTRVADDGDTPWAAITSDDTPWTRSVPAAVLSAGGATARRCDTPWS